jgi:hypothetical protein
LIIWSTGYCTELSASRPVYLEYYFCNFKESRIYVVMASWNDKYFRQLVVG